MAKTNLVIALAGALVLLLAGAGLMEIDSRAGPYDQALRPEPVPLQVTGSYRATPAQGSQGPGGVCVPPSVGGACSPPRLEVDVRVTGLPRLGATASYIVYLDGAETLRLGSMRAEGDAHVLQYGEDRDGQAYTRLLIGLSDRPDRPTPGPLIVFERDVAGQGRFAPAPLDASRQISLLAGSGRVRVAEIGGASISVTAIGELSGVHRLPEWSYQAWFEPLEAGSAYVPLGAFEFDEAPADRARLDARIESLRLEDQARLLVTLEPQAEAAPTNPRGFPVFATVFEP